MKRLEAWARTHNSSNEEEGSAEIRVVGAMEAVAGSRLVSSAPRAALTAPAKFHSAALFSFSPRSYGTSGIASFSSVSRPWVSLAVQTPRRNFGWRHDAQTARPRMAAQEAAQAEEGTEDLEEESDEPPTNGATSTLPLLEELKAAVAANDEESIAKLEARVSAMQSEKDALAKQVDTLLEESNTARERLLRLNADFDNFRKRSLTEKANLSSSVRGDVIETLLPMVDNFERARASIQVETEGEEKIDRSYQSIYKQFVEIMKGLGVVAVETVGKAFDPNFHEAIMREDSTEYEEGIVVQEFRRGFRIGDKLMRPAMVKVSAGPGPAKEGNPAAEAVDGEQVADVVEEKGEETEKAE